MGTKKGSQKNGLQEKVVRKRRKVTFPPSLPPREPVHHMVEVIEKLAVIEGEKLP